MKKIILFDIDYVLIDSEELRVLRKGKICRKFEISEEKFEQIREKYFQSLEKTSNFSAKNFSYFLAKTIKNPLVGEKIAKIYYQDKATCKRTVYPDVIPALKKLKSHCRLGIFSEGDKDFQRSKLILPEIINYFKKGLVFIYPDKTSKATEIVDKVGEVYIIDDNPKHIKDIALTSEAHPIWLKRGPKAQTEEKLNCPTIFSLEEVEEIIRNS